MTFKLKSEPFRKVQRDAATNTVRRRPRLSIIPFASVFLLLSNAADARAPSGHISAYGAVPTEHVRVADLDLTTPDGWRTARSRVRYAAARVCVEHSPFARCRADSVARAEGALLRQTGALQPCDATVAAASASADDRTGLTCDPASARSIEHRDGYAARPLPRAQDLEDAA